MSKTVAVFSSALLCLLFVSTASLRAQGTPPPDFTGVYSPIDPFGQARARAAAAPPAAAVPPPAAGTQRRGLAAAATGIGARRTCGPAGKRAEADA